MKTEIKSKNYSQVVVSKEPAIFTGIKTFDDFFSSDGGMVLSSVVLLTGSSGAGKTTFSIFLQKMLKGHVTSLYEREMSSSSVKQQTARLNLNHNNAFIADVKDCPTFEDYLQELEVIKPKVVIIDSLQVITKEDYADMSSEDASYKIITRMSKWAGENNAVVFIVGHVTKDNDYKGNTSIMHMVDAHLEMIYHKKENLRTIGWGHKNRKGLIQKLCYEITNTGLEFFTEEEYQVTKKEISLSDFILNSVSVYLSVLDKKNENYPLFKKDVDDAIESIADSDDTEIAKTAQIMQMVQEKLIKYGFVKEFTEVV